MPPGSSSADVDGESDGDDAETAGSDAPRTRRPRDPVLVVARTVERTLRSVDRLYARFDELPGRVQFSVGVVTFLSSAYFGSAIKRTVDAYVRTALAALLAEFVTFSPGVQVIFAMIALLVVQVTVVSKNLTKVGELVDDMTDDGETATDGGVRTRRVETSEAGALGGAGLGALFGGLFGTSTIFGGMIFGAIVGNLVEEWSDKRRKRRRLETKIVEYLLRERVFEPDAVERDTVRGWFPADDEGFAVEAIDELLRDDDSPVVHESDRICLVGASDAVAYLDRNGGRVPSAFAGPNRPPRPSEASD